MITEMHVDKETVFALFAFVSITGPMFGIVVGGQVTTWLGGYSSMSNMNSTLLVSVFTLAAALPIGFLRPEHTKLVVGLLWILLFGGGYMLPSITSILLNTVDKQLMTIANSIANTCFNIFGLLMAPLVYGFIADAGGKVGGNKRQAM